MIYLPLDPEACSFLSSAFPEFKNTPGSNFPVVGLAYAPTGSEAAFWRFRAVEYGGGNLTLDLSWYADTGSTGEVRWGASIAAITPNTDTQDIETKSFATEDTVDDTHLGTTNQRLHKATITISNLDSLAQDDEFYIRVRRMVPAGSNMSGDAILIGSVLSYAAA